MRQLYLNQTALSARATTVIRDAQNQSCYLLVGKWGLRADVLTVYLINGSLEAEVKQDSLGLLPRFRLLYRRQPVGRVSKTFGVIREVLFVRGLNWVIMGNLNNGRFRIFHGRDLIANITRVSPDGLTMSLEVDQTDHEALVVCLAAILDRWAKRQQKVPGLVKNRGWAPGFSSEIAPFTTQIKKSR
ncbi:LURP-one-related/scramblase family protein [Levilactobacillus suantsaii]|uniref:Uncharacterized protein n=1 Tax=Levilactobacillus suantsaii TaxID=2292255 RepID=A0A4Q0VK80_9LACO|nr:hypothetical protein [Levilactobacillus suantsaii]QMU07163.1 hypothetical protein H3M12_06550 [Levilactobacillus suantsaii]RXI80063.1 hypothetical protein DXH47_00425 [Levilactobacillus suantsaii]